MSNYLILSCILWYASSSDTVRPAPFAPGVLPVDTCRNAAPAFSPDGNTVYFHQSAGNHIWVLFSEKKLRGWTTPVVAAFSGSYRDLEPAFSPDGKYLIFASSRDEGDTGQIDGWYNGKVWKASGGRLWKVVRTRDGWDRPELLPAYINTDSSVFSPAIAANGDLYFMRADSGLAFHLYCSKMRHGVYASPERLPFSNLPFGDFDPAVARDGSFLIFSSGRPASSSPASSPPPSGPHVTALFIVYRTRTGWSQPKDLRTLSADIHGIEARLSPDNKTLYYSNARDPYTNKDLSGNLYIWMVHLK